LRDLFHCVSLDRFAESPSESKMESSAVDLSKRDRFLAGVVFLDSPSSEHVMYKLRMPRDKSHETDTLKDR